MSRAGGGQRPENTPLLRTLLSKKSATLTEVSGSRALGSRRQQKKEHEGKGGKQGPSLDADDIIGELEGNRSSRPAGPPAGPPGPGRPAREAGTRSSKTLRSAKIPGKKSRGDNEKRVVYVLGARPDENKAVPRATKGCVSRLRKRSLCEKSRRRLERASNQAQAYNHYKEYVPEEQLYESGRDQGEEVLPSADFLRWEGIGTMQE
jgi:hypothetical protein